MINNRFQYHLNKYPFLIMSHRGFWGGNIIQNTTQSAQLAYAAGADIVEIDICRSKDGVFYLFHDGGELDLLGINKPFWKFNSDFIDSASVLNSLGNPSGYRIQRLSEFLSWLPNDRLVNIDRSWHYWEDKSFFSLIHNSGKSKSLLLKSPVNNRWLTSFERNAGDLAFMPIVKSHEDVISVLGYDNLNTVGMELVVKSVDSELLDKNFIKILKNHGFFLMANAEKLGENFNLFANFDDDMALLDSLNSGWDAFISRNIDVIQTDWPNFLTDYRIKIEKNDKYLEEQESFKDYNGLVDPQKLRPLLGESYSNQAAFKSVVDLVNEWQMKRALAELTKLEKSETTAIDALRFKAEIYFVYEAHSTLMKVIDKLLGVEPDDLQALWLGAISRIANNEQEEAQVYIEKLLNYHPKWAEKLQKYLEIISEYSNLKHVVSDLEKLNSLDVIAIYGYGLTDKGEIPRILENRLLKGLELSQAFPEAKVIVSGGAVTTPFNEAEAMTSFLIEHGVSKERIIMEPLAKDTVGNSVMIAPILKESRFENCSVVTSVTHLPQAILSLIGALDSVDYTLDIYGSSAEEMIIDIPQNERRLTYSTLFRALELYTKNDLESVRFNDSNF